MTDCLPAGTVVVCGGRPYRLARAFAGKGDLADPLFETTEGATMRDLIGALRRAWLAR